MRELEKNETIFFDMYCDGSLETVQGEVICDSGDLVSFYFIHPIFPEAGKQIKCLERKKVLSIGEYMSSK